MATDNDFNISDIEKNIFKSTMPKFHNSFSNKKTYENMTLKYQNSKNKAKNNVVAYGIKNKKNMTKNQDEEELDKINFNLIKQLTLFNEYSNETNLMPK